jgi:hypothetical protein
VTTKSRRRRAALRAPRAPGEVRPAEPASDLRGLGVRTGRAAIRWAAASRAIGSLASWSPFYPPDGNHGRREKLLTVALTLALPVLIWRLARRVSRQDRATREDLIEGIW